MSFARTVQLCACSFIWAVRVLHRLRGARRAPPSEPVADLQTLNTPVSSPQYTLSGDLACTYAALILADDGQEVTSEKLDAVIKAAGVEIEPYWSMLFGKFLRHLATPFDGPSSSARSVPTVAMVAAGRVRWRRRRRALPLRWPPSRPRAREEEEEEAVGLRSARFDVLSDFQLWPESARVTR